ncbi:MAG TPA: ATP-binding protein [Myxococcaceae bacterium]|nr:ATP-binding protein [Myxococcaceae bacterium]
MALPLVLFSLVLFFWNFAALAYEVSGNLWWHWLDLSTSPLSTPLALHFVLVFVGRRRQLRTVLVTSYAAFGLISGISALAFFFPWAQRFTESQLWAVAHLAGLVPVVILGVGLLLVHLRQTPDHDEKARTELLLAAFAVLAILGSAELLRSFGFPFPPLASLGVLACNVLMAIVALRFRLLERPLTSALAWNVVALATLGIASYVAMFQFRGTPAAIIVLGAALATFAVLTALMQVRAFVAVRRERFKRLATMGRFSTQMAHDLKNPLAALKGAAQFLKEELRQGRPIFDPDFVNLILDQIDRVNQVVDDYQRLSRAEPLLAQIQINDVVRGVLALQPFASNGKIAVAVELQDALPACHADRQLLAAALENLVRNGFEAMPGGGRLTVRTARDRPDGRLVISVEDTGAGMDARTLEHAFDEFYTTKPGGTGLGLAFARRVAEAHGGDLLLTSREGIGTVARLVIPIGATAA